MSSRGRLGLGLLLSLGWLAGALRFRGHNVWLVTGSMAAIALLVSAACCGRAIFQSLFVWRPRSLLIGVLAGVVMAGATRWLYPLGLALLPSLPGEVAGLYGQLRAPPGPVRALPVLALAVLAEEVVFRGLLIPAARDRGAAVVGAALLYALAQLGAGSPALVGLALVCGLLWGLEYVLTGDLLAPLLTHLVWDLLVLVVAPLPHPL